MRVEVIRPNDASGATLTAYLQEPSPELPNVAVRPGVLILPGGAYMMCSDREAEPVALAFLAEGYQAFVLRYSVGTESSFEKALEDAESALAYLHGHAAEMHLDAARIAAIGMSAGGHLAAALATMGKTRPAALLLCYPCILKSTEPILAFPIPSLEQRVTAQTPPTFLFATSADEGVPVQNSLAFATALANAGTPFEMHIFGEGCHGLSLAKPCTSAGQARFVDARAQQWFGLGIGWLETVLG